MEQRIIQYVSYLKGIYLKEYDDEERKKICEQVLVQIGFFQHQVHAGYRGPRQGGKTAVPMIT